MMRNQSMTLDSSETPSGRVVKINADHSKSAAPTPFERRMFACFGLLVFAVPGAAWACFAETSLRQGRVLAPLLWLAPIVVSGAIFIMLLRETIHRREMTRASDAAQTAIVGMLEGLPYTFFALDHDGIIVYANHKAEAFLHQPGQTLKGRKMDSVLPASLRPLFAAQCARVLYERTTAHFECCDADTQQWHEVGVAATPEGLSVTISNITPRKRVEEAQGRLLAILEATPDLVAINDMRGSICYFNRAGREMLGMKTLEEGTDTGMQNGSCTLSAVDADRVEEELFPIGLEHDFWRGESTLHIENGKVVPISQVVIPHKGPDGKVAYLSTIARDITDIKRMEAQMKRQYDMISAQKKELERRQAELIAANDTINRHCAELAELNLTLEAQATTDNLTGLKNHRAFQQRLTQEFERSSRYHTPLSLLLLDVDKFKQFNDTFGHPAGDEVLKRVANILQSSARTTDMAARYGGEEFVVILPDTDEQGAAEAGERVRAAVEEAVWDKRPITVSVGVASMRMGIASVSQLIEEADKALYISKEFGRNCVTHHDLLLNALVLSSSMEGGMTGMEADCAAVD